MNVLEYPRTAVPLRKNALGAIPEEWIPRAGSKWNNNRPKPSPIPPMIQPASVLAVIDPRSRKRTNARQHAFLRTRPHPISEPHVCDSGRIFLEQRAKIAASIRSSFGAACWVNLKPKKPSENWW